MGDNQKGLRVCQQVVFQVISEIDGGLSSLRECGAAAGISL